MKTKPSPTSTLPGIVYSRYDSRQVAHEPCVPVHGLSCIVAGSLRVTEAGGSREFGAGSLLFARKNFLAKFSKQPANDGPFRAITVVFDAPLLHEFRPQYGGSGERPGAAITAITPLPPSPPLTRFYEALQPYFEQPLPAPLVRLRQQEALRLLLHAHPDLGHVLFDFGQPGKIDLETFMRQNFCFNVEIKQLAYLTGRSLATFKRDFAQLYHTSPARWLYRKRLEEAHYLLREQHQRPSDVYHAVGFESLAHFSTAFKQLFGRPPSSVHAEAQACAGT